jgi:hypothetical protein
MKFQVLNELYCAFKYQLSIRVAGDDVTAPVYAKCLFVDAAYRVKDLVHLLDRDKVVLGGVHHQDGGFNFRQHGL